jgi:apolipoprotein N-acyltransferase
MNGLMRNLHVSLMTLPEVYRVRPYALSMVLIFLTFSLLVTLWALFALTTGGTAAVWILATAISAVPILLGVAVATLTVAADVFEWRRRSR